MQSSGDLSVGAMVTHRRLELETQVSGVWPGVSAAFKAVASPRVRNVATIGGVLADADYASDPPSMLVASSAVAEVASVRGTRRIPIEDLIVGHYATTLDEDELITRVLVPTAHRTSGLPQAAHALPGGPPRRPRSRPWSTVRPSGSSSVPSATAPTTSRTSARTGGPATRPRRARSETSTPPGSTTSTTTADQPPTGDASSASRSGAH